MSLRLEGEDVDVVRVGGRRCDTSEGGRHKYREFMNRMLL